MQTPEQVKEIGARYRPVVRDIRTGEAIGLAANLTIPDLRRHEVTYLTTLANPNIRDVAAFDLASLTREIELTRWLRIVERELKAKGEKSLRSIVRLDADRGKRIRDSHDPIEIRGL